MLAQSAHVHQRLNQFSVPVKADFFMMIEDLESITTQLVEIAKLTNL